MFVDLFVGILIVHDGHSSWISILVGFLAGLKKLAMVRWSVTLIMVIDAVSDFSKWNNLPDQGCLAIRISTSVTAPKILEKLLFP